MKSRSNFGAFAFLAFAGTALCWTSASAQDARAYCAGVGNDDRVQVLPHSLTSDARRMFEFSAEMSDSYIQATTTLRCMNGVVWLCSYGANLACDKADVSRNSPGANRFCRQNPGSADIPMSATGHATIYEWTCAGRTARIVRQATEIDARGFIAENWLKLEH